ncbi:MAG: 30S ribosomal protein S7 [bacterium]|nr:30S ribosomal protein S7 [bacterium]
MANKFKTKELLPDAKFESVLVAKLINTIMKDGKKSVARRIAYKAFEKIEKDTKQEPLLVFEKAIGEVSPRVEVRPQRVGGATYQVPREVKEKRAFALALKWILDTAKAKKGKGLADKLAFEIEAAAKGEGEAIKKRDNVHKMAQANKAFAYLAR